MLLLIVGSLLVSVLDGQALEGPKHGKNVLCYWASWAVYRPGLGANDLSYMYPSLCTHIVFAFAGLDEEKNSVKILNPWQDVENVKGLAGYKALVTLKNLYPHLKVIISIGGWNEGSLKFSKMASDPETRKEFVQNVVMFLDKYKFDGVDLHWKYPTLRDGEPHDKQNFVLLIKDLRKSFVPSDYILIAAIGTDEQTIETAYDLPRLSRYLDLVVLMCYDYHGPWNGVVGANAPLTGRDGADKFSLNFTVSYAISHGVPPSKLVLGVPFYGRAFILQNPEEKDVTFGLTPALYKGFQGPYSKEDGFMGYNEICMELSNKSSAWSHHWDEKSSTPYLRDRERVISYDNARSIAVKVKYAIDQDLGGMMVWTTDTDDFRGICSHEKDAYKDFLHRLNGILKRKELAKALMYLNLPHETANVEALKCPSYVTLEGKLDLQLPLKNETAKNKLLRSVNDALSLAIQEKRIFEEIERVKKNVHGIKIRPCDLQY